jgi:glycosyltransferase involved in cell wall biosynthesis
VAPGDDAALASAMRQLATDGSARDAMAATAQRRAALLTWGRAAEAALGALREAAA